MFASQNSEKFNVHERVCMYVCMHARACEAGVHVHPGLAHLVCVCVCVCDAVCVLCARARARTRAKTFSGAMLNIIRLMI